MFHSPKDAELWSLLKGWSRLAAQIIKLQRKMNYLDIRLSEGSDGTVGTMARPSGEFYLDAAAVFCILPLSDTELELVYTRLESIPTKDIINGPSSHKGNSTQGFPSRSSSFFLFTPVWMFIGD